MTTKDDDARNVAEWSNPANWRGPLGIYHARRDSRFLVPKRNPAFGWTLNTAHPVGMAIAIVSLGVAIAGLVLGLRGHASP